MSKSWGGCLSPHKNYEKKSVKLSKIVNVITQRVIDHSGSELDKDTILLWRGRIYEHQKKYTEAENYYNILLQEDSFLSPSGGLGLARCKKFQGKDSEAENIKKQLKQKYPLI
ncbi:MAG: hypothetical protein L0Y36_00270 [Planctomycetales bacterium]|nr:hypothetical protein [Planctomycetales bacterium]